MDPSLNSFPMLKDFVDILPLELPSMPPPRAIYFHTNLVPRVKSVLRAPYKMTTHYLSELKN